MSRKLVQTVASVTAKQLRVAVAMLAALALGVGGAAAAVGSLNAASVSHDSAVAQTLVEDEPAPAMTADGADDGDDSATAAATDTTEESGEDDAVSDRNQTDCLLPAELLVTKAEAEAAAEGDEQADTTDTDTDDTPEAGDEAADDTAEVKIWRSHGEFVSSIARNKELANHDEAVRAAAQSDCGKPLVSGDEAGDEATDTEEDAEVGQLSVEDESLTTKRSAKADHDKRGNGHAKAEAAQSHAPSNGR